MPVDAKVAAILRPTWPDLPMPVTISRPLRLRDQFHRGGERLREPVLDRGDQRRDAAGLGLERAQRRSDQRAVLRWRGSGFAFGIR